MSDSNYETAGQLRWDPPASSRRPPGEGREVRRTARIAPATRAQKALFRRRKALLRVADENNYGFSADQRHELLGIEAALRRIAIGCWGLCEACGHAIGYQLLRAVPDRDLCLDCEPG